MCHHIGEAYNKAPLDSAFKGNFTQTHKVFEEYIK
jgi:hypothetical protein